MDRRNFIKMTGAGSMALLASRLPVMAGPFETADFERLVPSDKKLDPQWVRSLFERGAPQVYGGAALKNIGMPIGGICAGQLYLAGDGRLMHWGLFNQIVWTSDTGFIHPPEILSPLEQGFALRYSANGETRTRTLDQTGFPEVRFRGEYPIGTVEYGEAPGCPLSVSLEAFSPFIPLSVDDSSLPATVMRFTVKNMSDAPVDATLFGWLENAVCLHNRQRPGVRENRILRSEGHSFLECSARERQLRPNPRPEIIFEDWSKPQYEDWTAEGTAFGKGPIEKSAMQKDQGDVGGDTARVVNSYATAPVTDGSPDNAKGKLTSRPFKIERDFIAFWIGGGSHPEETCVNLIVNGKVARTETGRDSNRMVLRSFEVAEFAGQTAHLEIVDARIGLWANVGVGRIVFTDRPPEDFSLAKLPDFGTMGLALLGDPAEYAVADAGADGLGGKAGDEASASLRDRLVGALGRTLKLAPGASATATFAVTWNFPNLTVDVAFDVVMNGKYTRTGQYYATRFPSARATADHVARNFDRLHGATRLWRDTWYDSTLPYWFLDRTFANASTLATNTSHRFADGKFWGWEGNGCCPGTCTHVWHYEQTMGRIFPELDINLREQTDLNPQECFEEDGAVRSRGPGSIVAIDGQAGIPLRCLRGHQVSPDDAFLKRNWPHIKKTIEWLMDQDVNRDGILDKNYINTLDSTWYGEVPWLSGLYLAACRAGEEMASEVGDADFAKKCSDLLATGRKNFVEKMWNGRYFIQNADPAHKDSMGSYKGCEIDQVFGQSWGHQIGLRDVLPREQTRNALASLWKYNFTPDVGPYRKAYPSGRWFALAGDAGLLMCTWPLGDPPSLSSLPEAFFNECMSGFEHQVAGHMLWENMAMEGLAVERAIHDRYDGSKRNPWNEVECGNHYARAMASYGVFLAACGFEYHGPKGHIGFAPRLTPENFKAPFTASEGWGTFTQDRAGDIQREAIAVKWGRLSVETLAFDLPAGAVARHVSVKAAGHRVRPREFRQDGSRIVVPLPGRVELTAGQSLEVEIR
jgi:non-lysosomal glucosylceramidase